METAQYLTGTLTEQWKALNELDVVRFCMYDKFCTALMLVNMPTVIYMYTEVP